MKPLSTRVLAFLLGMVVSIAFMVPLLPAWTANPYTKVEVQSATWTPSGLELHASFIKNGQCKILSFSVIGFANNVPRYISYDDLDDLNDAGVPYDREEGAQGLNIFIPVDPNSIDYIETRTRHTCIVDEDGRTETITKVFSRHEAP
jgi:hypothetical protein